MVCICSTIRNICGVDLYLGKIGIEGVNSNLATAIRTVVVVITLILAFVFLHEKFTSKSLARCVLIGAGTLLMVM